MGTFPTLDQPPPTPPDVSGQMGAQSPQFPGMSSMLGNKLQPPQQGPGASPQGALIAQSDAIKKVLDQMTKMEPGFGPFAARIGALLDAGVGAVANGGPPGQSGQGQPKIQGPESNRPAEPGAGFPG